MASPAAATCVGAWPRASEISDKLPATSPPAISSAAMRNVTPKNFRYGLSPPRCGRCGPMTDTATASLLCKKGAYEQRYARRDRKSRFHDGYKNEPHAARLKMGALACLQTGI